MRRDHHSEDLRWEEKEKKIDKRRKTKSNTFHSNFNKEKTNKQSHCHVLITSDFVHKITNMHLEIWFLKYHLSNEQMYHWIHAIDGCTDVCIALYNAQCRLIHYGLIHRRDCRLVLILEERDEGEGKGMWTCTFVTVGHYIGQSVESKIRYGKIHVSIQFSSSEHLRETFEMKNENFRTFL